MADYMSPNPFITPDNFTASGGLGGFLAGQNQAVVQQMLNTNFISQDLQNRIDQYKAELEGAKLPGEEAAAAIDLAKNNSTLQNIWTPGPNGEPSLGTQGLVAGSQADLAKSQASTTGSKMEVGSDQFKVLSQIGTEAAAHGPLDPKKQADLDTANDWKQRAAGVGVDLGNPTDESTRQRLVAYANAAKNSIAQQQQEQLEHIKGNEAARRATITAEGGITQATINAQREADKQKEITARQLRLAQANKTGEQSYIAARDWVSRIPDDQITVGDFSRILAAGQAYYYGQHYQEIPLLEASTDPKAKQLLQSYQDQAKAQAEHDIQNDPKLGPIYTKLMAQQGGNGAVSTMPAPTNTPFSAATAGVQQAAGMNNGLPKVNLKQTDIAWATAHKVAPGEVAWARSSPQNQAMFE